MNCHLREAGEHLGGTLDHVRPAVEVCQERGVAAGRLRHSKGEAIEPCSAGVDPGTLDPRTVTGMAEAGVDISGQSSKPLAEVLGVPFDVVVTVCEGALGHYRPVRDQIRTFFPGLPQSPGVGRSPGCVTREESTS